MLYERNRGTIILRKNTKWSRRSRWNKRKEKRDQSSSLLFLEDVSRTSSGHIPTNKESLKYIPSVSHPYLVCNLRRTKKTVFSPDERSVTMALTNENTNQFRLDRETRDSLEEVHVWRLLPVTEWFGLICVPIDYQLILVDWYQTALGNGHRSVRFDLPVWSTGKKEIHSKVTHESAEHLPDAHDIAHSIPQTSSYLRRNSSLEC